MMAKLETKFATGAPTHPDWIRSYSQTHSHIFGVCQGEAPAIVAWMEARDDVAVTLREIVEAYQCECEGPRFPDTMCPWCSANAIVDACFPTLAAAVPEESEADDAPS